MDVKASSSASTGRPSFDQIYEHVQKNAKFKPSKEQCLVYWQRIQAKHPNESLDLNEDILSWIESSERVRLFWKDVVNQSDEQIGLVWKIIKPFYGELRFSDWSTNVPHLLRQIENVTGRSIQSKLSVDASNESIEELQQLMLLYFPDAFGFDEFD